MVSESDTNNFTYTAGDYIKTNVGWNPPDIKTFCKFATKHLVNAFPRHDIFMCGAFPYEPTWDVDIAIIGEPTDEAGKTIIDLTNISLNEYNMLVDITIYETPALFEGVYTYNQTGDVSKLGRTDMYKPFYEVYKNGEPMHYSKRKVEKISEHLYKHYTSLEEPQSKFKQRKKYIYEAKHISTFLKVYNV